MSQRYQTVQHFDLGTATLGEFTERSQELLVDRGFRVKRHTRRATESRLELVRGNPLLAILGANLGLFSRVRVELKVRQSKNEGEEGFRVTLRTAPLQEADDFEENWFTSNHGDRRKMHVVFQEVFELLEAEGLIVVPEDYEEPNRPSFFDPEAVV